MTFQHTIAIIKPDGVRMGAAADIESLYSAAHVNIVRRQEMRLTEEQVEKFYSEHAGKFFFHGLVLAMTSGPVVVLEISGPNAIEVIRKLNGATNPADADRNTIRWQWRSAGGPFNTVHGSDSHEAYVRERQILFGD